jgi:hypothetical protein
MVQAVVSAIDDHICDPASCQGFFPAGEAVFWRNLMVARKAISSFFVWLRHGNEAQLVRRFERKPAISSRPTISGSKQQSSHRLFHRTPPAELYS